MNEIVNDLKTDYRFLLGFLLLIISIFIVLPSVVIIHYLKEKQIIKFPKSESIFFRNRILLSFLLALFISLPFIFSGKLSMIFSFGLILLLFLVFFPFITVYCSKGKELTFDSENIPIPKYGQNNRKRRSFGFLLLLVCFVNLFGVLSLQNMNITISLYLEIYYFVAAILPIPLAAYFMYIIECQYCSCLNFYKIHKTCKHCSLEFE